MFDLQLTKLSDNPNEVGEIICHDKIQSFIGVTLADDDDEKGGKAVRQLGYVAASAKDVVKMGDALLELLQQVLTLGDDDSLYCKLIMVAAYEVMKKHHGLDIDDDE